MALNHIVNFNDGEALTHDDLNMTSKTLLRHMSGEFYARLADNYDAANLSSGSHTAGFQAVGVKLPIRLVGYAATLEVHPNRYYVALGESLDTGTDGEQCLMVVDIGYHEKTVTTNGGGSPRTDILSIPATEALAYAEYTSESRDFQDAVTGALSSQAQDKRYGWNVTSLTYTEGAAMPAGHVEVARFTVAAGDDEPVLTQVKALPMGARRKRVIYPGEFSFVHSDWTEASTTITSTAASVATASGGIPEGAFLLSAKLYYNTGVNSGDFLLGLSSGTYDTLTATSVGTSAWTAKDVGAANNIVAATANGNVSISNLVWRSDYGLIMEANGLDVRLRALVVEYIEH